MKNTIYILSLVFLAISIFLILNYPNSGRMNVIAGGLTFFGFLFNIAGFLLSNKKKKI